MEFKKLIQHIQIPRGFIQKIGINPSILLKELIDKEQFLLDCKKIEDGDFFFHEKKHIFINTALPRGKFDTARKKLEKLGLIEVKLGEGKKMFFKINNKVLNELFFPKANSEFAKKIFLEYILEDGYIFYPKVLAHKIGINETIFIKSLLSKRKYFEKQGKVKNGYFFNSVSNVKADTSLSKDQQLKVIKKLVSYELIDVQLAKDNTRYFCINDEKLIDFENLNIEKLLKIEESKKSTESESKIIANGESKKIAEFENPFSKAKSKKSTESESNFSANLESKKTTNLKAKKQINRKLENIGEESKKADINNTKLKILDNKTIKNNIQTDNPSALQASPFNTKEREKKVLLSSLLKFGLNNKNAEKLITNYSNELILKNLEHIKSDDKIINKPGFLIKSLEENYTLRRHQENSISKKIEKEKIKINLQIQKEKIEKQKQAFYKQLLENWILENKEQYDEIFKQEKKKFLETSSSNLKNPDILIKAKVNAYIKKEILGV